MDRSNAGSIRLLRVAGIDVFLHWSWFVVAFFQVRYRAGVYQAPVWALGEYVALFAIVTLHEFGHALACRSVGGRADTIVLWPLGGVAYVNPPPRPGPVLWSIAAGPLVNVFLVPVTVTLLVLGRAQGWDQSSPDLGRFLFTLTLINGGLLLFNLLPIYPLDGGQIVQALLWFFLGRWRSLQVVSFLGIAVSGVALVALLGAGQWWLALIAAYAGYHSVMGFLRARALLRLQGLPQRLDVACPACGTPPPAGLLVRCDRCGSQLDPFARGGVCPGCGAWLDEVPCLHCRHLNPVAAWFAHGQPEREPAPDDR
jgi:Zn-dependent protease